MLTLTVEMKKGNKTDPDAKSSMSVKEVFLFSSKIPFYDIH